MSTSNLGRDLGPFQPLRAQKHQFDAYVAPVEKDPVGAVERLRQLHQDTPIGQENNDLYAWADRMGCVLPRTELLSRDVWRKLIRAGAVDVCLDVIMRDDFWQSHWYSCNAIVEGTSGIVRYARQYKDPAATKALLARVSALWRSVWEKRMHLKSLRTYLDRGDNFQEPIVKLLFEYSELYYMQNGRGPDLETYIPHVGLHAWMTYGNDSPIKGTSRTFMCLLNINPDRCREFLREANVFGSATSDAVVSCIKRDFSTSQSAAQLLLTLPFLFALTISHDLLAFYGQHALVHEASSMIVRFHQGPGAWYEKLGCYTVTVTYLGVYTPLAEEVLRGSSSGPLGLQGADVIILLASGIDLLAANGGAQAPNGMDVVLCDRVSEVLGRWGQFYVKNRKGQGNNSALARPFCDDLKSHARMTWWPSLHQLETTVRRLGDSARPQLKKLAGDWAAFGKALGLDTAKERTRHEKIALNRCAWRECQYHHGKPDDVTLSACTGCGDARYCGRECQKSDWSKGGHKARCRRLK